jgi:hypothetical protein
MKIEDYERQLEWIRIINGNSESLWSELNIPIKVLNDKLFIDKKYEADVRSRVSPEYANSEILFR